MNKIAKRRVDMYDIGDGLTLMNVIQKNADGKMQKITTYIGIEGNGFVCVGNANELDAPGALFSYASYVRMQRANLPILIEIFERNTGVK
ncbi:MAG: hypothetical protein Q4E53_14550 [Eubacteriales bacterium]|nr:hypothetical protein [Eubacteriales bacterium]